MEKEELHVRPDKGGEDQDVGGSSAGVDSRAAGLRAVVAIRALVAVEELAQHVDVGQMHHRP